MVSASCLRGGRERTLGRYRRDFFFFFPDDKIIYRMDLDGGRSLDTPPESVGRFCGRTLAASSVWNSAGITRLRGIPEPASVGNTATPPLLLSPRSRRCYIDDASHFSEFCLPPLQRLCFYSDSFPGFSLTSVSARVRVAQPPPDATSSPSGLKSRFQAGICPVYWAMA